MGRRSAAIFWAALATVAYAYVGFPIWLAIRGIVRPLPFASADIAPSMSVIIPAYNEAAAIAESWTVSLLRLTLPDRLQLIVASDGSEDGARRGGA